MGKLIPLIPFPDVGFDDFDSGNGLGQPSVHHPKLLLPGHADRIELTVVIGQGNGQHDEEDDGHEQ